jgi:hypothetical protein
MKETMKIAKLYSDIVVNKKRPTKSHFRTLKKLDIRKLSRIVHMHNRYVLHKKDRITEKDINRLFIKFNPLRNKYPAASTLLDKIIKDRIDKGKLK